MPSNKKPIKKHQVHPNQMVMICDIWTSFGPPFVAVICVICFYYIANSMSIINRSAAINYRTYCKSTVFTVFCRDLLLYNPAYLLENL